MSSDPGRVDLDLSNIYFYVYLSYLRPNCWPYDISNRLNSLDPAKLKKANDESTNRIHLLSSQMEVSNKLTILKEELESLEGNFSRLTQETGFFVSMKISSVESKIRTIKAEIAALEKRSIGGIAARTADTLSTSQTQDACSRS